MKFLKGALISLAAFLIVLALIAQLWVAIFFPVHMHYNVVNVWRAAPVEPPATVPKHRPHGQPIIEGGIASPQRLWRAMHDPAIADSFEGFDFATAQLIVLDHSILAFVSYRLDGKGVFWTVAPVLITKGELVWRDENGNMLRARCGNRIAYAPGLRVAPEEEVPESALTLPELVPEWKPLPGITTAQYVPPIVTPRPPITGMPGVPMVSAANPYPNLLVAFGFILVTLALRWRLR